MAAPGTIITSGGDQQVMSPNRAEVRAAGDDRQQTPNGQNPFSPQDDGCGLMWPTKWHL